jgi:tRNA pseudouridine32 synthase / 23S rRNA pseudouridine746 synthase
VTVRRFRRHSLASPVPLHIHILHATDRFVVINKPSGLLSVPGKAIADCVAARVQAHFPNATGPLIVHRLDMETSGLMVFGLDAAAQRDLSMQFERRSVEKNYVAVLAGNIERDEGEITLPIRADLSRRPIQIVDFVQGSPSVTRYRVLSRDETRRTTRVEFTPLTGRSHQLRLHSAAPREIDGKPGGLGCPILGDPLYGDKDAASRLLLHASRLAFDEPGTGLRVRFECEAEF